HQLASYSRPPPAALAALAHRLRLADKVPLEKLEQACTHPSIRVLVHQFPDVKHAAVNANLATLGNALLGLFASEHVHASYPHLPLRVLKAAVSAYVGPLTCANVAKEIGAIHLARWHRSASTNVVPAVLHQDALASIPRALTALVYTYDSLPAARAFVHAFFLSRDLDLRPLLKFRDPKLSLIETVAKLGRERPVSRLLSETGRASNSPMFVVGVYSGADKLGEGFGSSLKMAEYRAAEDALHRFYLTRVPPEELEHSVPSHTFLDGDLFERASKGQENRHVAAPLGASEVRMDSAGRSGRIVP
ncbi:ribonuclease III domain-containing protein, partial [Vararia minispora EC-137]